MPQPIEVKSQSEQQSLPQSRLRAFRSLLSRLEKKRNSPEES
jgi:hypothetical protein